jgi:hypothetical protein
MREGLDAPTFELPPENVEAIRGFLDGQSRFKAAVWVRHEHQGVDGPLYDHHLVLAVADEDWATGDLRALDDGMRLPMLDTREPKWVDICPVSELDALRSFCTVLWERASPGDDSLDYRFTFEPFEPDPVAIERFAASLAALPAVRRVGADVSRLWKGDEEVRSRVRVFVDAPFEANVLEAVVEAARESVLAGHPSYEAGIEQPDDTTTILYEAVA